MGLFDVIQNSQGAPVEKLADKFGVSQNQVSDVIGKFLPALTNGMKKNISEQGLDGFMNALRDGGHDRYLDNGDALTSDAAARDGDGILGHLFGDKDVSRELARRTAEETGVGSGLLKKMLPMIAGLAMGAMKRQTQNQGLSGLTGGSSQSSLGPLMSLLDADGDGSVIDDVLGLAARFLRR